MQNPTEVLEFWLKETGPKGWYMGDDTLDATIRDRFMDTWIAAKKNKLVGWTFTPESTLALLIVLDQFPRNMFRNSGDAFSTDRQARCVAKKAIDRRWDMRVPEPERQFFYMPLMHSECLYDQERCVRLLLTRMPETGTQNLQHAKAHREVIRRFGRFPYRNEALHRMITQPEAAFLEAGGYRSAVEAVSA